jgi:hypothetical protein
MKQCIICRIFISVANKGSYGLEAHINSDKDAGTHTQIQICYNTPKVSEFSINRIKKTDERAIATEGALSLYAVKHHLSCRSMGCTSK